MKRKLYLAGVGGLAVLGIYSLVAGRLLRGAGAYRMSTTLGTVLAQSRPYTALAAWVLLAVLAVIALVYGKKRYDAGTLKLPGLKRKAAVEKIAPAAATEPMAPAAGTAPMAAEGKIPPAGATMPMPGAEPVPAPAPVEEKIAPAAPMAAEDKILPAGATVAMPEAEPVSVPAPVEEKITLAAPAAGPVPEVRFCMRCGAKLFPGQKFCAKCGTPVGGGMKG